MEKRQVKIQTFTPKYDPLEDRIRLSINYNDMTNRVDFMITRSFVLKLLPVLDEYMLKHYGLDLTITPKAKEEVKKPTGNTSKTDNTNLELYKQDDELLITIDFSFIEEKKLTLLRFKSSQTEAFVHLDGNAMKQIFTLIKSTIPFFDWGISHNI